MGICCANREQIFNIQKFNLRRRESIENKNLLISSASYTQNQKRNSIYIYNNEDIYKNYDFEKEIGKGFFGKVSVIIPKNDINKRYACKTIDKSKLSQKKLETMLREIETLSLVDHPNIVKFYETYNDTNNFHIIMELCTGGDLFTHVANCDYFTEKDACHLIYKITSAIVHCHSLGIVHRDLKPENILFENKRKFSEIKLIDFGLSRKCLNDDDLKSIVGTPYYVAPEVLEGIYNEKCDVWSIGIIAYSLLNGSPPFVAKDKKRIFEKIKKDSIIFPLEKFSFISERAKKFILRALTKNPKKRPTSIELLKDKWLEEEFKEETNPKKLNVKILKNLVNYHKPFRFTQRVQEIIVKNLDNKDIKKFKEIFNALDVKKIGLITFKDLDKALKDLDLKYSENKIKSVGTKRYNKYFKNPQMNNSDLYINFTSFITAVINKDEINKKSRMMEAFKILDTEQKGILTIYSLQKAFERTGKKTTYEEMKQMLEEIGLNENSTINFDEFCAIVLKDL